MKLFRALMVVPFTLFSSVDAQNSSQLLAAAKQALPECALDCMLAAVNQSTCQLSDFFCITHDEQLIGQMETCIKASCTIRQQLTAKNFSSIAFGEPIRDHTHLVSYTSMIAGGIALVAVILRIFARLPCFGGTWGLDDWAILVAMLPVIPLTGLSVVLAEKGLGRDMWHVPFDNITYILHIYYFDESLYLSSIALTKISILFFYLRIFPGRDLRRWIWLTIALCTCYIIAFIPVTVFQCIPIRLAWERWDNEHSGNCINLNAEGWTSAVFNIVFDIMVICIPLRELNKLAMSRRKKAGIMLMFLGGGFVTVVSMLRLKWLIQFANTENVTWDYTPVGYWSTLEVHVGIIIACLPAVRALQHRVFPSTKNSESYYGGASAGYGQSKSGHFPSVGKFRSKSDHDTIASQASMIRSRDRSRSDKEFIQLDEYEVTVGSADLDDKDCRKPSGTLAERPHRDSPTSFLDSSGVARLPNAAIVPAGMRDQLSSIKKEVSVNIEYSSAGDNVNKTHEKSRPLVVRSTSSKSHGAGGRF